MQNKEHPHIFQAFFAHAFIEHLNEIIANQKKEIKALEEKNKLMQELLDQYKKLEQYKKEEQEEQKQPQKQQKI